MSYQSATAIDRLSKALLINIFIGMFYLRCRGASRIPAPAAVIAPSEKAIRVVLVVAEQTVSAVAAKTPEAPEPTASSSSSFGGLPLRRRAAVGACCCCCRGAGARLWVAQFQERRKWPINNGKTYSKVVRSVHKGDQERARLE